MSVVRAGEIELSYERAGVGHLFYWEWPERSAELVRAHATVRA
jgi:hypothetical protein